jgi:hypothetical protein
MWERAAKGGSHLLFSEVDKEHVFLKEGKKWAREIKRRSSEQSSSK